MFTYRIYKIEYWCTFNQRIKAEIIVMLALISLGICSLFKLTRTLTFIVFLVQQNLTTSIQASTEV